MHACVKLADERDAVFKPEEHTKGMFAQVANAEARAVKAENNELRKVRTNALVMWQSAEFACMYVDGSGTYGPGAHVLGCSLG